MLIRSCCGLVSVEDPTVAVLPFRRFLKEDDNPYLKFVEKGLNTAPTARIARPAPLGRSSRCTDSGGEFQEEKRVHGNALPTEVAEAEAKYSCIDKQKEDGKEAVAGAESRTSVEKEIKSNNAMGAGVMEPARPGKKRPRDVSRSRDQAGSLLSGGGEPSFARTDQKGCDQKENGDRVESGPTSTKRKEAQPSFSADGYTHDMDGAKRRKLDGIQRGL